MKYSERGVTPPPPPPPDTCPPVQTNFFEDSLKMKKDNLAGLNQGEGFESKTFTGKNYSKEQSLTGLTSLTSPTDLSSVNSLTTNVTVLKTYSEGAESSQVLWSNFGFTRHSFLRQTIQLGRSQFRIFET